MSQVLVATDLLCMDTSSLSNGTAFAATEYHIRRTEGAKERQAPLWLSKPPGLDIAEPDGDPPPSGRGHCTPQSRRSPSRAHDRTPNKSLPSSVTSSPAQPQHARQPQGRDVQPAEPPDAGSRRAPISWPGDSAGSGGQRRGRRQRPRPGSAPAPEPLSAEAAVQPEGSRLMLRAAVQAASNSRPGSAGPSRTASAHNSCDVSPSKPAPKTLAPGPPRASVRRPASAASSAHSSAAERQLQEERERAERAEDQLDQLTRSLAQEKSTSSALQAERAALERLQAELAERCSLLELKARMLEQSAGQPHYAEEGLIAEEDDIQYATGVQHSSLSDDGDGLQHEDPMRNVHSVQQSDSRHCS